MLNVFVFVCMYIWCSAHVAPPHTFSLVPCISLSLIHTQFRKICQVKKQQKPKRGDRCVSLCVCVVRVVHGCFVRCLCANGSGTSCIGHLVTRTFVSGSLRYYWSIRGIREQFVVLEQSSELQNRVSQTFTTEHENVVLALFFFDRSSSTSLRTGTTFGECLPLHKNKA